MKKISAMVEALSDAENNKLISFCNDSNAVLMAHEIYQRIYPLVISANESLS